MGRFKTTSSYITMVASKMGSLQPPSLYCRRLMKLQKEWNARSTAVKVPASFRNLQVVNAGGYIRVNVSTAMFAAFLSQLHLDILEVCLYHPNSRIKDPNTKVIAITRRAKGKRYGDGINEGKRCHTVTHGHMVSRKHPLLGKALPVPAGPTAGRQRQLEDDGLLQAA